MAKSENELTWQDLEPGCIVTTPGNTTDYKTGDWRSQRPKYNLERCLKCGVCALFCPEGCINKTPKGYFIANPYHCKGCGICAKECPASVITMEEESSCLNESV